MEYLLKQNAFQQNICHSKPCPGENFICQVGFTAKRYRCVCRDGFKGENCDEGMTRQVDCFFFFFCQYELAHFLTNNPDSSVSLLKRGPCGRF